MDATMLRGTCWGLLPARGGSKSVPLKNIAPFADRPLIDYTVAAARASRAITRLICSTDSEPIAAHCRRLGVEVRARPESLAGDDTPIQAVIEETLNGIAAAEGAIAEYIALLQPTSPFLLSEQIDECFVALVRDVEAGSAQTVIECPHNHHAVNQRVIEGGRVHFRYPAERRASYNKQRKRTHYLFGNVVVFRAEACLRAGSPFAEPSLPMIVDPIYGFDADGPEDFQMGSLLVESGFVSLPHMAPAAAAGKSRTDGPSNDRLNGRGR